MRSFVLIVLAAILSVSLSSSVAIPVSAVAPEHKESFELASGTLNQLNTNLNAKYQLDTFTLPSQVENELKEWTLTTDDGAKIIVQTTQDKQLYAAWNVDADGQKTMIFHVKAAVSSTAWILGFGLLFVALGVIVVMSSKPSIVARERPVTKEIERNTSPTSATGARRRRSKLD
ncbi:hypothetical protein THRCLA_21034 [Thraustotheca clavata]|uniref:Secreted protein n=1 Tax=Thraustotheca clavata TaxID=74557 RepID=A0A1W0A0U7_9STRA|nr:hypothetical protein THRCLA_21034 [Thraustotheca clavata]